MSRKVISRLMLVTFTLLVTVGLAACTVSPAPSSAAPGSRQSATPTATTEASAAASTAASPPAAEPTGASATPGPVQNLVVSHAVWSDLRAAFLAFKGLVYADVIGPYTGMGTLYYAYDPATGTYWAMGQFLYSGPDYSNGGGNAMFEKAGAAGAWQVQSAYCPRSGKIWEFFPPAVLTAWSISTSVPLGPTDFAGVNC